MGAVLVLKFLVSCGAITSGVIGAMWIIDGISHESDLGGTPAGCRVLEAGHDRCNFSSSALSAPHAPLAENLASIHHSKTSSTSSSILNFAPLSNLESQHSHTTPTGAYQMPAQRLSRTHSAGDTHELQRGSSTRSRIPLDERHRSPSPRSRGSAHALHSSTSAHALQQRPPRQCFDVHWDVVFIDAHGSPQYGTIHAFTRTEDDALDEESEHKENREYPCIYRPETFEDADGDHIVAWARLGDAWHMSVGLFMVLVFVVWLLSLPSWLPCFRRSAARGRRQRWCCCFPYGVHDRGENYERIAAEGEDGKRPLSPSIADFLDSLRKPSWLEPPSSTRGGGGGRFGSTSEAAAAQCAICLAGYDEGADAAQEPRALNCGHHFHRECIGEWLQQKFHCPVCVQPADKAKNFRRKLSEKMSLVRRSLSLFSRRHSDAQRQSLMSAADSSNAAADASIRHDSSSVEMRSPAPSMDLASNASVAVLTVADLAALDASRRNTYSAPPSPEASRHASSAAATEVERSAGGRSHDSRASI